MMRSFLLTPLLAVAAYALPQDAPACSTTTEQVIVPTGTNTYYTTAVTTIYATTPRDLGTFTDVTTISSTTTIHTLTGIETACIGTDPVTVNPTSTIYTSAGSNDPSTTPAPAGPSGYKKRALGLSPRQDSDCVVTETSTTTYGETYTFVQGSGLSTYTDYTAYTQATVSETRTGGRAYTISSATSTTTAQCGPTVTASNATTATITQDQRCAPSSLVSKAGGNANGNPDFGISYIGTITGATFSTNTSDASQCCQLCADAGDCAASAWDIRNTVCRLYFTAAYDTGEVSCGNQGIIGYYGAGPSHPLAPGSALFVGDMCGTVGYFNAKPDDGS